MNPERGTRSAELIQDSRAPSSKGRVVLQALRADGIWTEWENGYQALMPYKIDANGKKYADLFPDVPSSHLK